MSQIRVCPTPPQSAVEYPLWNQDRILRVERRSLQEVANGFCHMSHEIDRTFHKTHLKAQEIIIFYSKFLLLVLAHSCPRPRLRVRRYTWRTGRRCRSSTGDAGSCRLPVSIIGYAPMDGFKAMIMPIHASAHLTRSNAQKQPTTYMQVQVQS